MTDKKSQVLCDVRLVGFITQKGKTSTGLKGNFGQIAFILVNS